MSDNLSGKVTPKGQSLSAKVSATPPQVGSRRHSRERVSSNMRQRQSMTMEFRGGRREKRGEQEDIGAIKLF